MFRTLIQEGMAAQLTNNQWFAYADNLEEFFRSLMRASRRGAEVPDESLKKGCWDRTPTIA